jgi:hypothetical protein
MIANKEFLAECRNNCISAREELCWEKESKTLEAAFRKLAQ